MTRRRTTVTLVLLLALGLVAALVPASPAAAASPTEAVLISVSSSGVQANGISRAAVANADGTRIAFESGATNFVPGPLATSSNIWLRDTTTGTTELVTSLPDGSSVIAGGTDPSISDDGTRVVFTSISQFWAPGDTNQANDVYLRDLAANTLTRISRPTTGPATAPNGASRNAQISGDGTRIVYSSKATDISFNDAGTGEDIYVFDVATGTTTLINPASPNQTGASTNPSISDNGSVIAFESSNPAIVPGDSNERSDVFVKAPGQALRRIQRNAADQPNGNSTRPDVSGAGNVVVFQSEATDMVLNDTNGQTDVFGVAVSAGPPQRLSVSALGAQSNGESADATVSEDGGLVAFTSLATNLAPGDTVANRDIYVRDGLAGTMSVVDVRNATTQPTNASTLPDLPDTGPFLFYTSASAGLVNNDTNNGTDVFRSSALRCDGRRVTVDLNAGGTTTAGADIVRGSFGADNVALGAGNDRACMGNGNDTVNAEAGSDRVFGGLGIDTLSGSIDNDALFGEAGNDALNGGPGTDTCDGGQGATDTAINCETKVNVP